MKLLKLIDNVSSIKALGTILSYCKKSSLYTFLKEDCIIKNIECQSVWKKNDIMYYHGDDNTYKIYNLKEKYSYTIDFSPYLFTLKDEEVFGNYDFSYNIQTNNFDWKVGLFNIRTNEKIDCFDDFDKCNFVSKINEVILGFNKNKNIAGFQLTTKCELWQFPISQLSTYITDEDEEKPAELISIIGVHNTILWLLVTDRRLIALDTETGTLLHEINLCEALGIKPQTVENYSFSLGDTHLNEEKEKIKGFAHRYYWELDLNSLQAEIKVDFGEGNTWRIKKSKYYQEDKNLYFTGARSGETFDRAIGVFDTQTYQITWYDEPLDEGRYLFFADIQANDKLIGALDSEQNLRIYEKE